MIVNSGGENIAPAPLEDLFSPYDEIEQIMIYGHEKPYLIALVFPSEEIGQNKKSLQKILTCVETPWYPTKDKISRRLINEIVLGEESDIDQNNNPVSHFELYVESMKKIGSDTNKINEFLNEIVETKSHKKAVEKCLIPTGISDFLNFTFDTIDSNKPHIIASVFTFGREDLIPDMFINIVKTLNENNQTKIGDLLYYLERHIEVDGDEHGPMALKMISELCQDDDKKWYEATLMSKKALEMRIKLWDYIESHLN